MRLIFLFLVSLLPLRAMAGPQVVAAESLYGEVAGEIGQGRASVASLLAAPAQDPHTFEPAPRMAIAVSRADIVIANGAGYDPWMDRLIAANPNSARDVIIAAAVVNAPPGANPHLWYDPAVMPRIARLVAAALIRRDPQGIAVYQRNLTAVLAALAAVQRQETALRGRFAGARVAATEAVAVPLAQALGLDLREPGFGRAVMNGTEPRASDIAAMEADLAGGRVRALIVNPQVATPLTRRLAAVAGAAHVPVVPMTETLPPGRSFAAWMGDELGALAAALARPPVARELQ